MPRKILIQRRHRCWVLLRYPMLSNMERDFALVLLPPPNSNQPLITHARPDPQRIKLCSVLLSAGFLKGLSKGPDTLGCHFALHPASSSSARSYSLSTGQWGSEGPGPQGSRIMWFLKLLCACHSYPHPWADEPKN